MPKVDVDELPELPRWPWIVLIVVILLGALALAARPAAREVRAWQARRQALQAETVALRGQVTAALNQLQSAAQLSPGEPEVSLRIARLLGALRPGEPPTIAAWERAVGTRPGPSTELELALQRFLGGGEAKEARRALEAAPRDLRESANGRFVHALLALQAGQREAARGELDALGPDLADPLKAGAVLLLRARLRLAGPEPEQTEGLGLLRELQRQPLWAAQAGQQLRDILLQRRDFAGARREAEALTTLPEAGADAYLGLAAVEFAAGERDALRRSIDQLRARAREDRVLLGLLLAWLGQVGERAIAAEIVEQTNEADLGTAAVVAAAMPVLDRAGQVERLRGLARRGDWIGREAERDAWQARLAALGNEPLAQQKFWASALASAAEQEPTLRRLLELTRGWNWLRETEAVLARLVVLPKADRRLLEDWWQTNVALRSARGIQAACRRLLDLGDNSLPVRNDYAAVALLLGEDVPRAQRLALENFEARPRDPIFRVTYAASLRLQGRLADAWAVLAESPDSSPAVIFERMRVLTAQGRREEALRLRPQVPVSVLFPEQQGWLNDLATGQSK